MSAIVVNVDGVSKLYRRGPDHSWTMRRKLLGALFAPYRKLRGQPRPASSKMQTDTFWALKDINFALERGERLGIIGENGAGKSTLLKILSRIVYPTVGEARLRGRVASLLEVGTGFSMDLTGRENVYLSAALHGLERKEIDAKFEEIVDFSGVREFLDTPVKRYSSGMFMRLAFSVAAHIDPDILLLDEVLAVGDLAFQKKCMNRVEGLTSEGRTVLFVSHSMDAIARFCTRVIWLEHGCIVRDGPTQEVIDTYVEKVLQVASSKRWVEDPEEPHPNESELREGRLVVNGSDLAGQEVNVKWNGTAVAMEEMREAQFETTTPFDGNIDHLRVVRVDETVTKPAASSALLRTADAPGDEDVRLVSTRVINKERRTVVSIAVDEPVGIEMTYDVLKEEKLLLPALRFYSGTGIHLFNAVYTDPAFIQVVKPVGRYISIAWIPGNLLNCGIVYVSLAVSTPGPQLERHFVLERAIAFHVHDVSRIEGTARGLYTREFPGAVRPKLAWETQRVL